MMVEGGEARVTAGLGYTPATGHRRSDPGCVDSGPSAVLTHFCGSIGRPCIPGTFPARSASSTGAYPTNRGVESLFQSQGTPKQYIRHHGPDMVS